jgi:dihydroxyacid dehydratase/phosphogluconate dehydratase
MLDWWEESERRRRVRLRLRLAEVDPDRVILDPDSARRAGLTSTMIFPSGNLAPAGAVVKATAMDSSTADADGVYRHRGPARVFTSEQSAVRAIKGRSHRPIRPGDVIALIGIGPAGTGMEEIYQVTSALKFIPWGKHVPVITDGRFSGVSTGACIGHVGPEALAGGPLGRLRDGDLIEIVIDRVRLEGRVDLVGAGDQALTPLEAGAVLAERPAHPDLGPHPDLPDDTRLWAALQEAGGGAWAGCVYDVDRIIRVLKAGTRALSAAQPAEASEEAARP